MIQIYADGALIDGVLTDGVLTYDSRLEDYDLQGLKVTSGLNKGGTAEIVMPPGHPAANAYVGYRTVVEIRRDGDIRFRGRALYPVDDVNNARTVVCEGERCFLRDGVSRPYLYQDTPAGIFRDVMAEYNAQVDAFKRFKVGVIDVTDPSGSISLEGEEAETISDTINKLIERCGGYIVFTTDSDGVREINWRKSVGSDNTQIIEAGENLFDFQRTGANTDLATVLIPYGAKNETTGKRVTIVSANSGLDYIKDVEAVAIRGAIYKTVTWDDIIDPENLLTKARQYLDEIKLYVTSLTLTALDLSYIDKSIESFKVGDRIRAVSRAHGLDGDFQLVECTEDLMNPAGSFITLGKEIRTLTSLDVAGDIKGQHAIQKAAATVKQDANTNNQQIATELTEKLTGQITKSAEELRNEVAQNYAPQATLSAEISRLEARIAALEA